MTKAETIFAHELSLIHDKDTKQFVITCFDKLCPDYFWTCPCSTTGKYHPKVSLGVGGLVRHTKLAVWWGLELINALRKSPGIRNIPSDKLLEETVTTLLLHDMLKNGKGLGSDGRPLEKGVTGTHGVTLAEKINDNIFDQKLNSDSYIRILTGIQSHMGIWTIHIANSPNNILDPTKRAFADLIHLADYCASRKVDSIYSDLEQEKTNDFIKQTTNKNETRQSPPCPGVRPAKSHQTTAAENGQ